MRSLFFFDKLITPGLLVLSYWLSLASLAILTLSSSYFLGIEMFSLKKLAVLVFGGIGIRIGFEIIMIVFKNNEYLRRIAEQKESHH